MRYSDEYKRECIEQYRRGEWPETPPGIKRKNFREMVRRWVRIEENLGIEAIFHKKNYKHWTADEKLDLVMKVLSGESCKNVAFEAGIGNGMLSKWVQKYKVEGYNGLIAKKKGRPSKEPPMKKKVTPAPLTESEREELIRLRTEVAYMKAENEVIKKRIALRREEHAAQLKAKKQRLSKNSGKKDTN